MGRKEEYFIDAEVEYKEFTSKPKSALIHVKKVAKRFRDDLKESFGKDMEKKFRGKNGTFSLWRQRLDFHYAIGCSRNVLLKILAGYNFKFISDPHKWICSLKKQKKTYSGRKIIIWRQAYGHE